MNWKWDKKTIALLLSVVLNVAGGFGIVPPMTPGATAPACLECPRCGETELDGGL
jgi:hypothetical protein